MVSRGSVRTAARRRMGTEKEAAAPSRVDMDFHDLRRMEELEARRRTCGHVVMLFYQFGVRRARRDVCVFGGVRSRSMLVCKCVCAGNAAFSDLNNHTYVGAEEGELVELDGRVSG
jgi:hypothetical protein